VPASSICFHSELPRFKLSEPLKTKNWLNQVILSCKKKSGDINFIFCSDKSLLAINRDFLKHDYFTDVITFDYSEDKIIAGDIYISIDRVKDNARQEGELFETELRRVMVHGVLHLLGLADKTKAMHKKENFYLTQYGGKSKSKTT
jgi:probable rRNA maturation factor